MVFYWKWKWHKQSGIVPARIPLSNWGNFNPESILRVNQPAFYFSFQYSHLPEKSQTSYYVTLWRVVHFMLSREGTRLLSGYFSFCKSHSQDSHSGYPLKKKKTWWEMHIVMPDWWSVMISWTIINANSQQLLHVGSCHQGLQLDGACFLCLYSNQ